MKSIVCRARCAAITILCAVIAAACNSSSPVDVDSTAEAAATASGLEVSPIPLDFGSTATTASVTLKNTGTTSLTWTASESVGWLTLGATSGTIAAKSKKTLSMSANRTGRSAGTYTRNVQFDAGAAGSVTQSVSMTVPPTLSLSPLNVNFGSTATSASVTLTNTGTTSLTWTASESVGWLALGATSGTIAAQSEKTLSMSAKRIGKSAGTYTTNVQFDAGAAGSVTQSVSMIVPSTLSLSPLNVNFGSTATSASVTLTNTGTTSLTWTASESAGWLALGATSGTIAAQSTKTLSMSADRTGRSAGTYTTNVQFAVGTASSATASVSMTVPSTSTSVLLAGQLVDQFDGHALAGLTVQFDGKSVQTNGSGLFTIAGSPTSGLEELTLSGTGAYRRVTFARTGDSRWQVVPSSFNMAAFDDLARDDFGASTIRWAAPPTVYVDNRPEGFTSTELSTWISDVKVQAAEFISKWSGAVIEPSAVIVTSSPPANFTDGTIVIHFSDRSSDFGGSSLAIGYARLSYDFDRSLTSSAVWLRYTRYPGAEGAGKRKGILGHELGHAMGYGHMITEVESLMGLSLGTKTDLSAFDRQAASVLYSRSPDNTSPDTDSWDSYRGNLAPSGLPSSKEWICGAEEGFTGSSQ